VRDMTPAEAIHGRRDRKRNRDRWAILSGLDIGADGDPYLDRLRIIQTPMDARACRAEASRVGILARRRSGRPRRVRAVASLRLPATRRSDPVTTRPETTPEPATPAAASSGTEGNPHA
jgi:hypothetical protein